MAKDGTNRAADECVPEINRHLPPRKYKKDSKSRS